MRMGRPEVGLRRDERSAGATDPSFPRKLEIHSAFQEEQDQNGLQSPSMDFALRANLRLFKFVPDEFVRVPILRIGPGMTTRFMLSRIPNPESRIPKLNT